MQKLIILLAVVLVAVLSILVYEPLELDVKVCSTDWGADCDNLEILHGQSLYVYVQSNKQTDVTIMSADEMLVTVDGFEKVELPFDFLGDSVMVNDQLFSFEVYDDVTPEYFFVWDTEADE